MICLNRNDFYGKINESVSFFWHALDVSQFPYRFSNAFLAHSCINLRVCHRFVSKQGGYGVYANSFVQKPHGKRVPEAMEGDMFVDLGFFNPF